MLVNSVFLRIKKQIFHIRKFELNAKKTHNNSHHHRRRHHRKAEWIDLSLRQFQSFGTLG